MEKKPKQENRSYGDRKPYGDRKSEGDRKPYGEHKPAGERKPYGDRKPAGDRKPYGDRKPAGDRKPYGDRKTAGDRKPYGDRKPVGDRKPYGDRKSAEERRGPCGRPAQPRPQQRVAPAYPSVTSRKVALEIFGDVMHKDAYAALSLDERLGKTNLTQLDKRFCASLVYRTLENLIRIDYVLGFFLKDADALEPQVRDILRISACQLLFHDRIPENAVVDEAVKLTRALGLEGLTGLTNAVLRALVRGKDDIQYPAPEEGARYLSIMFSVPLWLAEKLLDAYGPELAKDICAYRTESHYTVVRPNLARMDDAAFEALLKKKVWEVERGAVAHAYRVRMASEIARDADYLAGNFSIQGESSMLAAQAADVRPGMQVLDCCAAPGGKTAYLAECMNGTGRVYAWDVHDHRVALLRAMQKRLGLDNVRPAVRDATALKEDMRGTMDVVLLDAPCSGLGVMDDKPDIKYRASAESVRELAALQEKLLDTCCQYVRRGGALVYSTCSLLPEENGEQIGRFLEKHPEFALSALPDTIDEKFRARQTAQGLQLLPCRDGVEGFFIARLRRVK